MMRVCGFGLGLVFAVAATGCGSGSATTTGGGKTVGETISQGTKDLAKGAQGAAEKGQELAKEGMEKVREGVLKPLGGFMETAGEKIKGLSGDALTVATKKFDDLKKLVEEFKAAPGEKLTEMKDKIVGGVKDLAESLKIEMPKF